MIIKHQKEETVARLKKAYSSLSQTTQRAIADNGPINTWQYVSPSDKNPLKFVETYITPYMSIMNKCIDTSNNFKTTGSCKSEFSMLNGNTSSTLGSDTPRFILSDGTLISMILASGSDSNGDYIIVYIDINGAKKPNRLGKDVFKYYYYIKPGTNAHSILYNSKFVPTGIHKTRARLVNEETYSCNKSVANEAGAYCSALIMKDGWQIKDDYPW